MKVPKVGLLRVRLGAVHFLPSSTSHRVLTLKRLEIRTRGCWVKSAIATSVLCYMPNQSTGNLNQLATQSLFPKHISFCSSLILSWESSQTRQGPLAGLPLPIWCQSISCYFWNIDVIVFCSFSASVHNRFTAFSQASSFGNLQIERLQGFQECIVL